MNDAVGSEDFRFKYCIQMSFHLNVGLSAVIQETSPRPSKITMGAVCHGVPGVVSLFTVYEAAPGFVRR